ncbi:DNA polymerase III, delta subunit [Ancylobacter novellus DSM 506]|uniref:DNA-directed DNA polymerase n=1 Tax=Ancylobacter novellus (strain ATCC 8093 / DSM 506 / JCM 20403 / CCM 1077 / IAM 12100 / NBRC 12443 / NCIMB 10456) TaxID=639283 RepID=D6ZYV2_ANCN5|nr:DNA polymerase III subunit delta [Ancylobacter novellus]ADH91071.1 DNA polymerase III, delta subunit [Ancylobacter novellus DSM 506]
MVAVRPADVEATLTRIDPLRPVLLLFGPDSGLVRERARAYLARAAEGSSDPFGLVRLDGDEIAGDPGRLVDEAGTVALFGGRRVISLRVGSRNVVPAVEALLAAPPGDAIVVIEAGDLKRGQGLRALCEASPRALAITCYADTDRDLTRLIDTMVTEAGLSIDRDARAELMGLLGGDRLASRGEIAKLLLYAAGEPRITAEHVRAIVGDASSLALDEIADSAFAGQPTEMASAFAKASGEGMRADIILGSVCRTGQALHLLRLAADAGSIERAIESARPAIHFRRKPLIEKALRSWSAARLEAALLALDDALLAARRNAALGPAIAERALLQVAGQARRG